MAFRMDCCEQLIDVSHVARLRRRLEGIITVSNEFWLISFGLFICVELRFVVGLFGFKLGLSNELRRVRRLKEAANSLVNKTR